MASGMRCQSCGKGIQYGHNVSHSKRRTKRLFKPNLHKARIKINGVTKTMKLCTKCLRIIKEKTKTISLPKAPILPAAS